MKKTSMQPYKNIDEYISNFPDNVQKILEEIRSIIKKEVPADSLEAISYGIPCFKLNDKYIVYFAGYEKHVSIYPIPNGDKEFQDKIAPYIKGRGTMQFQLSEPIPFDLIKEIVKHSVQTHIERAKNNGY